MLGYLEDDLDADRASAVISLRQACRVLEMSLPPKSGLSKFARVKSG